MNKKIVPKDFSLSLVLVDAIPVILFCMTMFVLTNRFPSKLFLFGVILVAFAGICKVLWKLIVVLFKKNVWILFIQMRITMPIGFLLIIISLFMNKDLFLMEKIISDITSMPQVILFMIGGISMILMLIFGFTLDGKKVKNNWFEQIVNCIGQLCFFVGVLLIK